jgi:hypothetical protein
MSYGLEDRDNSVGVIAPGVTVKLIDPLTGKEAPDGKQAIMCYHTPWMMKGLLNNQQATDAYFGYSDAFGSKCGTNLDIASIARYKQGKADYVMHGRVTDFVLPSTTPKKYSKGITFSDGKVAPVNFNDGYFLFNMRDRILNVDGVEQIEVVLLPNANGSSEGTIVADMVLEDGFEPISVIKSIYASYGENDKFVPEGLLVLFYFARSLATDKRETASLRDIRDGYYKVDSNGNIVQSGFLENGESYWKIIDNTEIVIKEPPMPMALTTAVE